MKLHISYQDRNVSKIAKPKVKSLREEMVTAESKHLVTQNQKLLLEATQVRRRWSS